MEERMRSSYRTEDVCLLLKDITGMVKPQLAVERERLIQSGVHYCEMLPVEYVPSQAYMEAYDSAVRQFARPTALAVERLANRVMRQKGRETVLVSLARAGIPVGILLKHNIRQRYGVNLPHYAISIIRGRGIDRNAMKYLLENYAPEQLLFVDGWIGKGAIWRELKKEIAQFPGVSPEIAVLADPAYVTELCGTHEDILIPSACLNCTVSGLISRTFLRGDIIGEGDFHGAVYYGELAGQDLSYAFLQAIEREFRQKETRQQRKLVEKQAEEGRREKSAENPGDPEGYLAGHPEDGFLRGSGWKEAEKIALEFGISNLNLVKPGIGETTRVLLRRVPWKVLVDAHSKKDPALEHILRLAEEKGVPVEYYPMKCYKACGLIKKMADT